jgi:hypothetical protein
MPSAIKAALPVAIAFSFTILSAQLPTAPQSAVADLAVSARDNLSELRAIDT